MSAKRGGGYQGGGRGPPHGGGSGGGRGPSAQQQQHGGHRGGGGGGEYRGGGGGGYGQGGRGGGGSAPSVKPRELRKLDIVKMAPTENLSKYKGTTGQSKNIVVNYYKMKYNQSMVLNRYRVDYFMQKVDGTRKEISTKNRMSHRERFWKFVSQYEHDFFFGRFNVAYDDAHEMYTVRGLKLDEDGKKQELAITEQLPQGEGLEPITIVMVIKFIGLIQIQFDNDSFKVLNLVLTQWARCPLDRLNANVHCEISRLYMRPTNNYHQPLDLGGFHMCRGLYSFAKQGLQISAGGGGGKGGRATGQAFANFDVTHSAFYKVALDILQFYAYAKAGRWLGEAELAQLSEYGMNQNQRNELRTLLNGLKVKKKKISADIVESEATFCDVVANNSDTHKFDTPQYGRVSVREYYLKRYGYRIRFPAMPLIQLHPREKGIFLPIEVLRVSDRLQRLRRKLPDALQALTNQFTTTEPKMRFSDIDQMVKEECHVTEDPFMDSFNVAVDPKFLEIGARIIPAPNCEFSKSHQQLMGLKAVEKPQYLGVQKTVIFDLIIVDRAAEFNTSNNTLWWKNLIGSCRERGIPLNTMDPIGVTHFNSRNLQQLAEMLESRMTALKQFGPVIPVMIVVLPDNSQLYKYFKGLLELRFGGRSQMILSKTIRKLNNEADRGPLGSAVARNIFLKINAKCGGVNCKIGPSGGQSNTCWTSKFANPRSPSLFIGIDVTHPAPGDTISPSISALVGNVDIDATRFTATVRAQNHRMEWIEEIAEMFNERLEHFTLGTEKFNKQKLLPSKVIVFRDGVSESQFEGVIDIEYDKMKKWLEKKYEGKPVPKLTFIVVQKRHNTRFYDPTDQDPKNKANLQPGTVVDGFITSHPKEFYLCSHKGLMGTSKPAHYFIIKDENGFTADDLEICSNNLCYLFARAPMPVSIPAPVYYAHLACYRARHHYAAADDDFPVRPDGTTVEKMGHAGGGDRLIREPIQAVQVVQSLRPTMYFT